LHVHAFRFSWLYRACGFCLHNVLIKLKKDEYCGPVSPFKLQLCGALSSAGTTDACGGGVSIGWTITNVSNAELIRALQRVSSLVLPVYFSSWQKEYMFIHVPEDFSTVFLYLSVNMPIPNYLLDTSVYIFKIPIFFFKLVLSKLY
jgi:hypothetical protein